MDSTRANFYWDSRQKKKYHMVKWADLAMPREFGGLGFTDTRLMNKCLLSRWIIKLERGDSDLCSKMLRKKYLNQKSFLESMIERAHSFGRGYMKQNIFVRMGLNMWWVMVKNPDSDIRSGLGNVLRESSLIDYL
jgi:hypothetical protein